MPEIAERRQTRPAVAPQEQRVGGPEGREGAWRGPSRVSPISPAPATAASEAAPKVRRKSAPPNALSRCRRGQTQGEPAHQHAHHQPGVGAVRPAGRELRAHRVDARQRRAGGEARRDGRVAARGQEQDRRVRRRAEQRRHRDHPPRIVAVGQGQGGADQRAEHEPRLHRPGQQRLEAGPDRARRPAPCPAPPRCRRTTAPRPAPARA